MVSRIDAAEYPFKPNFERVGGFDFHYVDEGEGHPVVMLHGNPTWSFYFRHVIKDLSGSYRVIAPDHIGCGKSEKPGKNRYPFTYERRVRDVETFIDKLEIKVPITLMVHDWGGMIGMAYACRHPEKIRRLIVTNTTAFRLPQAKRFPWQLALARTPLIGRFLVQGLNGFALPASYVGVRRKRMSGAVRSSYLAPYDNWKNREAIYRFIEDIPLTERDSSFQMIQMVEKNAKKLQNLPMLVVWGKQDIVFDTHFFDEWRERFPNAEFHLLDDAGHYVLEDAKDQANMLIRDFLTRT